MKKLTDYERKILTEQLFDNVQWLEDGKLRTLSEASIFTILSIFELFLQNEIKPSNEKDSRW